MFVNVCCEDVCLLTYVVRTYVCNVCCEDVCLLTYVVRTYVC